MSVRQFLVLCASHRRSWDLVSKLLDEKFLLGPGMVQPHHSEAATPDHRFHKYDGQLPVRIPASWGLTCPLAAAAINLAEGTSALHSP